MGALEITGLVVLALIALGLLANVTDLMRYIHL